MPNTPAEVASSAPLRHNPRGSTALGVLLLSLGVGSATALFGFVDCIFPHSAPIAACESIAGLGGGQMGFTFTDMRTRAAVKERVSDVYEAGVENASDAIDAIPDMADGLGDRAMLAGLGVAALGLLLVCTRLASKLIANASPARLAAATMVGALVLTTLSTRALDLPPIGPRSVAFALCIALLAVYFARGISSRARVAV